MKLAVFVTRPGPRVARLPRGQGLDEIAAFHLLVTVDEIAALHQEPPPPRHAVDPQGLSRYANTPPEALLVWRVG